VRDEGLCLDAGALIAIERDDMRVSQIIDQALRHGGDIHIVAGVLAQVWRGGSRQARLSRFLGVPHVSIVPLDEHAACAVGQLCGLSGHSDIVDVHVVLHARSRGHTVVTSDPDDLRRVDRRIPLIVV